MRVSEIFSSVQGEGPHIGTPAIFLRLSGCNLSCGFCDTKYALTEDSGKYYEPIDAYTTIQDSLRGGEQMIVVTGGEPILQQKDLYHLLIMLRAHGKPSFVEIETNGTIEPTVLQGVVDSWIVSPKMQNSNNPERLRRIDRWFLEPISHLPLNPPIFKFVVKTDIDLIEVEDFIKDNHIKPERVYLMPMATDACEHNTILGSLCEYVSKVGYKVSPRLQILAKVK